MLNLVLPIAIGAVVLAMALNLWRMAIGPSLPDRILGLDTLSINAIALVMLLDIVLGSVIYLEAALILAMMGFVGTVALCKFILSGDIIE
ncbi:K+/H+ antiporter subunit F [Falsiroseomonas sp.]|jgi:multicomponent K+:H+ antiporter subunit F|uniref:K+/H+ antiporter subunit F n=1 Tax=Falsiroseomonas sp. TaxID=2870721 RepID=UPI0033790385|nr:K+/H+ antiporter subunit F [Falsiroseomonas sp.]